MAVELYLVRHGQTFLNKYHRIQGWSDSPLTAKGIADAKRAGERLAKIPFAAAYASDTTRAQNTAKNILAANQTPVALTTEPAFREENFGYFEGLDTGLTWHTLGTPVGLDSFNAMIAKLTIEKTKDMFRAKTLTVTLKITPPRPASARFRPWWPMRDGDKVHW